MIEKLINLQTKISEYHNSEQSIEYLPRISFTKINDLYEINFYGEGYDDDFSIPTSMFEPDSYNFGFCALQEFMIENPGKIVSVNFTGPDSGANGTRNWNFNRLINSDVTFKNLLQFKVALTDIGDHNQSTIGEDYDENGMIAKLVSKMPGLEVLVIPSAPDKSFFEIDNLSIKNLVVQAGYDHQNFIANLSQSNNLRKLRSLDYTDVLDYFGDMDENGKTSFTAYKQLFQSELFSNYEHFHFKLRDSRLTNEQLVELQETKKIQLFHINTEPGKYIRLTK